ncbi:hypothetical protein DOY81_002523 [Sarcophaga bullata]|nr:hypothetical protein DOY81_002523 [Sarcophaga bullata]
MRLGAVLYVYKGEWGLPTIDFECLRVLCLVKFAHCPVTIETNSNPLRSGAGKLPYMQIGNEKFVGYRKIKKFLDKEGYPVDVKLKLHEKHLSESFSNWVFMNLHAYYHYFMFSEPNNFEIVRSFYAKRTPFPFNFYYPSSYQKEAHDIVLTLGGFDIDDKLDLHEVDNLTNNAKKCVNILSKRLGRNLWFFGDQLSELDAIVFSYLSILYKITLPNNPIQNHIKGCQNLVHFINRISKDIFKKESFNSINTSKDDASPNNPLLTATERKFLESERKTKILAGISAVVAMSAFAATKIFYKKKEYFDGINYDDDDEFEEEEMD